MSPQCKALLSYLKSNKGGVTTMEAMRELGICRLSERIAELEINRWDAWARLNSEKPVKIKRERVKVPTRSGYATVTRYFLA